MTLDQRNVDFARLVDAARALGDALGLEPIAADAIERRIREILVERSLLDGADLGIITEREAACALLDRVMTWMLDTQSKSHAGLSDYSWFEHEAQAAMFGNTVTAASN